jgi:Mor family transcriptional regulator
MNYYIPGGGGTVLEKNDVFKELETILGTEAANRFVDYYSGSILYTPKSIIIARKHRKIREEFKNGATYRELAVRYGYTETHIRNIVYRKERKDEC